MQRAIHPQATFIHRQSRVLPGHGTGLEEQAANDGSFQEDVSFIQLALSVIANVIGGALLLSGMFFLPQVIARILS